MPGMLCSMVDLVVVMRMMSFPGLLLATSVAAAGFAVEMEGAATHLADASRGLILCNERARDIPGNLMALQTIHDSMKEVDPDLIPSSALAMPSITVISQSQDLADAFTSAVSTVNLEWIIGTSVSSIVPSTCRSKAFPLFCLLSFSPYLRSAYLSPSVRALGSSSIYGVSSLLDSLGPENIEFDFAAAFGHVPFALGGGGVLEGGRWVALTEVMAWCGSCQAASEVLSMAANGGTRGTTLEGSDYAALTRALSNSSPPPRLLPLPPSYNVQEASTIGFLNHGSGVGATHNHGPGEDELEKPPEPIKGIVKAAFYGHPDQSPPPVPSLCEDEGSCGVMYYGLGNCKKGNVFMGCAWGQELKRSLAALRDSRTGGLWWISATLATDDSYELNQMKETIHGEWGFPWVRIVPFGADTEVGKCIADRGYRYAKYCFLHLYVPYKNTLLMDADVYLYNAGVVAQWFEALKQYDLLTAWECCGRRMKFLQGSVPLLDPEVPFHGWEPNIGIMLYRNTDRLKDFAWAILDEIKEKQSMYDEIGSGEQAATPRGYKVGNIRTFPLPPNHHFREWVTWRYTDIGLLFFKADSSWYASPQDIPDFLAYVNGKLPLLPQIFNFQKLEDETGRALGLLHSGTFDLSGKIGLPDVGGVGFIHDKVPASAFFEDHKMDGGRIELPRVFRDKTEALEKQVVLAAMGGVFDVQIFNETESPLHPPRASPFSAFLLAVAILSIGYFFVWHLWGDLVGERVGQGGKKRTSSDLSVI